MSLAEAFLLLSKCWQEWETKAKTEGQMTGFWEKPLQTFLHIFQHLLKWNSTMDRMLGYLTSSLSVTVGTWFVFIISSWKLKNPTPSLLWNIPEWQEFFSVARIMHFLGLSPIKVFVISQIFLTLVFPIHTQRMTWTLPWKLWEAFPGIVRVWGFLRTHFQQDMVILSPSQGTCTIYLSAHACAKTQSSPSTSSPSEPPGHTDTASFCLLSAWGSGSALSVFPSPAPFPCLE